MKQVILFLTCLLLSTSAFSQVGIETVNPDASAALDITSTTRGLLLPRMTAAERDLISVSPAETSLMIYCTNCGTNGEAQFYNGAAWVNVVGGVAAAVPTPSITSTTGKIWMDRNLGATRVAQSIDDHFAYGDLYQWGRAADGHEKITWTSGNVGIPVVNQTTPTKADIPAHAMFITSTSDWRENPNDDLWSGLNAENNPCPAGFRVPTSEEITAEVNAYGIIDSAKAFDSPLKFTVPGHRNFGTGALTNSGSQGRYWSSSVDGSLATAPSSSQTQAINRYFRNGGTFVDLHDRASGYSVRCIKHY